MINQVHVCIPALLSTSMMHMQLPDTGEIGNSCNSNFLILVVAFKCSNVYSIVISIMLECICKVLRKIVNMMCASCHDGAYKL